MNTRLLFNVSSLIEVLTGIAMLLAPSLVIELLLGDGLGTIGVAVTRVLGLGLLSLGVAAWESRQQDTRLPPRAALCIYNVGVAALLAALGTTGSVHAPLLWPVAILHGLIGAPMLWTISVHFRNYNIV